LKDNSSNNVSNIPVTESGNIEKSDLDKQSKFSIDSLLLDMDNEYLATYKNGELALCCYEILETSILNFNIFKKSIEEYNEEEGIQKVEVYSYGDSYIKEFYNSDPQVDRLDLVCGSVYSDKIELSNGIKIGMSKLELLSKIFIKSDFTDSVRILTVYENEIGDYWTSYIFNGDSLSEVRFDSSYDWIDKGLKK
jgi:hypothetical protein